MEILDFLIPLLPVFASAYLTSLLCRFARRQHDVRWYFGLVGAIVTGGFICLFIWLGFFFQNGQLPPEFSIWTFLLKWLPIFVLPPALTVTWYYRRIFRGKP
jgi:hypothetical protein